MTDDMMNLRSLVEKIPYANILCEMIGYPVGINDLLAAAALSDGVHQLMCER